MRPLLFAVLILLCDAAVAQPSVSIGMGGANAGGGDCRDVARQIVREWMDVGDVMGSDGSLKRPSANDFGCVAPEELKGAMSKHVGATSLRCYSLQGTGGVCCDSQMSSCAALSQ